MSDKGLALEKTNGHPGFLLVMCRARVAKFVTADHDRHRSGGYVR
jgi:hypothetical protein